MMMAGAILVALAGLWIVGIPSKQERPGHTSRPGPGNPPTDARLAGIRILIG